MAGIEGNTSGAGLEVDPTMKAGRATLRPIECEGWFSLGVKTGLITTLAAGGAIFSLRNLSAKLLMVRRVGIGFLTTTAFTTPQEVGYGLAFARAFTASDTGGTAVAITGNNLKHRTALAVPTSVDCRVSTTAVLGAGTKVVDANDLAYQSCWSAGVGMTLPPVMDNLFSQDAGDYPLMLNQNEGINIFNRVLMGAAGVGNAIINLEFAQIDPSALT